MLYGDEILCSVVFSLARLIRALMPLCSSTTSAPEEIRAVKKLRSVMAVAVGALVDEGKPTGEARMAPPEPVLPAFRVGMGSRSDGRKGTGAGAARVRPSRLVIPAPVACAGVNPFGGETDAAAVEMEAQGVGFCVASRRGVRHAMEDGYGVIADKAFYGVYDGHGGRAAVDLVADRLGENILAAASTASPRRQQPSSRLQDDNCGGVMAAIRAGYLTTDSELLSQGARGGACAATVLVKDGELYVANVGDCRAVLGSRGGGATALTSDHTPEREDERVRIESSGGYVSRCSGGVWRVQDSLAVSRALGDADMRPWVSCEPEVSRHRLTPDCAFLVLASDGLWSKVSNEEAVGAVAGAGAVSVDSCRELVDMARSRGSRDDVTVMLVDLQRLIPAIES